MVLTSPSQPRAPAGRERAERALCAAAPSLPLPRGILRGLGARNTRGWVAASARVGALGFKRSSSVFTTSTCLSPTAAAAGGCWPAPELDRAPPSLPVDAAGVVVTPPPNRGAGGCITCATDIGTCRVGSYRTPAMLCHRAPYTDRRCSSPPLQSNARVRLAASRVHVGSASQPHEQPVTGVPPSVRAAWAARAIPLLTGRGPDCRGRCRDARISSDAHDDVGKPTVSTRRALPPNDTGANPGFASRA